jgi:hypothetical protein
MSHPHELPPPVPQDDEHATQQERLRKASEDAAIERKLREREERVRPHLS